MKLTGELEKKVEQAKTKDEAKQFIKNAGMILTDEELNQATGGLIIKRNRTSDRERLYENGYD